MIEKLHNDELNLLFFLKKKIKRYNNKEKIIKRFFQNVIFLLMKP